MVAEIIEGELVTSPRPASPHARATSALGSDLFGNFDGPPGDANRPGGWWILDEPELHLGPDVVVPDIAGWRRERMPTIPKVAAFTLAPDWVCEVISPSTARIDREGKMRIYARAGVGHLWILDPLARTLEIYRLVERRWEHAITHARDAPVRAVPFEAIELVMQRWWLEG
jgi:Uma2 family endonuclease